MREIDLNYMRRSLTRFLDILRDEQAVLSGWEWDEQLDLQDRFQARQDRLVMDINIVVGSVGEFINKLNAEVPE